MRGLFDFRFNQAIPFDRCAARLISIGRPSRGHLLACSLAIGCVIATSAPVATRAQTCVEPLQWPADATSLAGNSCYGSHLGETLCGGQVANPGLNIVYRIYVSGNASEIDSMSFNFIPVMYLSDETHDCESGPCLASGSSISLTGLSPGYYRLIVAHSNIDAAGACGLFTLTADAPLSETDIYFDNGFD